MPHYDPRAIEEAIARLEDAIVLLSYRLDGGFVIARRQGDRLAEAKRQLENLLVTLIGRCEG